LGGRATPRSERRCRRITSSFSAELFDLDEAVGKAQAAF
jgi:hypothetical protein